MKNLITLLFLLVFTVTYSQSYEGLKQTDITKSAKARIQGNSFYIIKAEKLGNSKLSVDVKLTGSKSKENMESVFQIIRTKYTGYNKTFVTFYTTEMLELGAGCYATRHSTDGKVVILNNYTGLSTTTKKVNTNSPIVGVWRQTFYAGMYCTYTLKNTNNTITMTLKYTDGSGRTESLVKKGNGVYKVLSDGKYEDEYYKLDSNGRLSIRDSYGSCDYLSAIK